MISLIAAVARNGVIGSEGTMPWRIKADLKLFRARTLGKPVIMGRRTFEAIGKPLDGRANLVVSRDPAFRPEGVILFADPLEALITGQAIAEEWNADEVMVIGGGKLYAALIGYAGRLYITHIDADYEGDTFFPSIDPQYWRASHEEPLPWNEGDTAQARFVVYERCPSSSNLAG